MNQNHLFNFLQPFSPLINLFIIFTLFCLERKILAVDSHYTACNVSTTCGSQEIKFPFYIPDQQESFCGYPGFELFCRNNKTLILTLPNNDDYTRQNYTIQEIFNQNQSLRVSNSVVLDAEESCCIPPIENISIPYDRFKLASNQRKLFLLSRCNLTDAKEFSQHKVNCSGKKMDNSVLALFGDDPVLGNASEKCREAVVAPVDVGEEGGVEHMLRRGFVMEWMANNCSFCEASGGICGFDKSTYHFECFCPDGPHASHCVPKDMVGARKNINAESDHSSEYFPQWIYRRLELDEELGFWSSMNENDEERARKMIIVGLWCIQTHPSNRPPMYRVVEMLKGNLDALEIPPKSFLSSPPRPPADANIDFDSSSSLIL
ncbi:hypothetical protein SLEP1_g4289 [Rubroshorea leprosula]|uniref:non-specific serine/threonine protein kinase n=1 Tax=Rubroshorea leprosula TaxID=152421 RepID=A0AAV5HYQ3_9ROSI|nr:hypothetical protein SLEP1_g4289 [Rubroshorea leprosula]